MKPTVLIIEDEASLVTMLRYNLEKEGFNVAEASDGEEAMTVAEETAPDAIILDWMLPRMSGIEVCRQLRRKTNTRSVPIIMLTARGEETDKIRGLNVGADDYMTDPAGDSGDRIACGVLDSTMIEKHEDDKDMRDSVDE